MTAASLSAIVSESDPEVAYFREIERAFVERRGDPLFISNADWVFLARLWKKRIPKRVVLRGITDAFDAHAHSFSRKQKIRSLSFCEDQITAAVERYRRAEQSDGPGRRGLSGALEAFAEGLSSTTTDPRVLTALDGARVALRDAARAARHDKAFAAEKTLNHIEDQLMQTVSAALGPDELQKLAESSRDATAAYRSRMPARVYETLIAESVRRKTLQRFGIPRILLAEIE